MIQILLESPTTPVALSQTEGVSWIPFAAAVGVFVLLICAIAVIRRKLQGPELMNLTPEEIKKKWAEIMKTGDQGTMGGKIALMEADKLLDHVLKSMMIPGETLGERLKMAAYKYPAIKNVWSAHKLRNQLVHDASFDLRAGELRRALSDFHDALRTLRVL